MWISVLNTAAQFESIVIWSGAFLMVLVVLGRSIQKDRRRESHDVRNKNEAVALRLDRPPAQHPMVDTSLCIGCGSCIAACPEGDVLGLVQGKASIINGLRCVGHGRCAEACPVEAVQIGLGDISKRHDLPLLDDNLQTNIPGVYIAGELGGLALVKNAVKQGEQAARAATQSLTAPTDLDYHLVVVGAGPAGLSAALTAKQTGLSCLILDREKAGGTILQYPRRKMMLTQPVDIPLYGRLERNQYLKEELLEIWDQIFAAQKLNLEKGRILKNISSMPNGLQVETNRGPLRTHRVILALGRRGSPRKLGIPGEDKAKVAYQLVDAETYRNEKILVVGGGDSAVEAAVALSLQPGNEVTLAYRKNKFFRIKQRNMKKLDEAIASGQLTVRFNTQLSVVEDHHVVLSGEEGESKRANNYVFVFAGGVPPFGLLKEIGITFGGGQT